MIKTDDYYVDTKLIDQIMQEKKQLAVKQLSKLLPYCTDELICCLAYAYLDGVEAAEKIAVGCNLEQIDFFAIVDDVSGFYQKWLEEQEYLREQASDD